ncbi:GyrI-like domain-containing protein [Cohnella sp. GCM10027633]|uniref:AraC family transcriptional regulator n=1 Tax=unclassified Cohnella TaxID=2636738 RepID=UPI00362BBA78
MRLEWLNRMSAAIDEIERTLEDRLDIEQAAKAAYTSPFHFQRMFHMVTGMTVAEYACKRKLTLAAQELATTGAWILDVSLKYGYDSPESFAKAFRKLHGIAPSEARGESVRLKAVPRISFQLSLKGDKDMDYRVVERDAFRIIGKALRTTCKDGENSREIPKFWQRSNQDGTVEKLVEVGGGKEDVLGVCLDMQVGEEEFNYLIAVAAPSEAEVPEGYEARVIPAYTWAVFTSVGAMPDAIQTVWNRVFQEWFPATGYEHAGGPEFELYPPGDVNADDYRCEVWLPVAKK